jgi:hypothetical protein
MAAIIEVRNFPTALTPWRAIWFGYTFAGWGGDFFFPDEFPRGAGSARPVEGARFHLPVETIREINRRENAIGFLLGSLHDSQTLGINFLEVRSQRFLPEDGKTYVWNLTTGEITVPRGPNPDLFGEIYDMRYWHEGLSGWRLLEGAEIPVGRPVHFSCAWVNRSTVAMVGHVDLFVVLPSGERVQIPAAKRQDETALPQNGWIVEFSPVVFERGGNHRASAVLTGWEPSLLQKKVLDEKTVPFSVPFPAPVRTPMGRILDLLYWQEGMGAQVLPLPGAVLKRGLKTFVYLGWSNEGETDIAGRGEVEIRFPDGESVRLPALENQEKTAPPGRGSVILFGPFTPREGRHEGRASLLFRGQELDRKAFSFEGREAPPPPPSPPPSPADLVGAALPLLGLGLLAGAATSLIPREG